LERLYPFFRVLNAFLPFEIEISNRISACGMNPIGSEVHERGQNKAPVWDLGVRNGEFFILIYHVVEKQDIQVEGPGFPFDFPGAKELVFDPVHFLEYIKYGYPGNSFDNGVHKIGLMLLPDGKGPIVFGNSNLLKIRVAA
jgi:hypothetical protein